MEDSETPSMKKAASRAKATIKRNAEKLTKPPTVQGLRPPTKELLGIAGRLKDLGLEFLTWRWDYVAAAVIREIAVESPGQQEGLRGQPERWTSALWSEVLGKEPAEDRGMLWDRMRRPTEAEEQMFGELFKIEKVRSNGYRVSDYKDPVRRWIMQGLMAIFSPTRTTYLSGMKVLFLEQLLEGQKAEWGGVFHRHTQDMVKAVKAGKGSYLAPFVIHLYRVKGWLTKTEAESFLGVRKTAFGDLDSTSGEESPVKETKPKLAAVKERKPRPRSRNGAKGEGSRKRPRREEQRAAEVEKQAEVQQDEVDGAAQVPPKVQQADVHEDSEDVRTSQAASWSVLTAFDHFSQEAVPVLRTLEAVKGEFGQDWGQEGCYVDIVRTLVGEARGRADAVKAREEAEEKVAKLEAVCHSLREETSSLATKLRVAEDGFVEQMKRADEFQVQKGKAEIESQIAQRRLRRVEEETTKLTSQWVTAQLDELQLSQLVALTEDVEHLPTSEKGKKDWYRAVGRRIVQEISETRESLKLDVDLLCELMISGEPKVEGGPSGREAEGAREGEASARAA